MSPTKITTLSELLSSSALDLLAASGKDFFRQVGLDVVRGVVLDVLTGRNLRDSTETLTRRRIAALNLATVNLFIKGSSLSDDFISKLPELATDILMRKRIKKSEKWLAQWTLGLTDKAFQNVLRDNPEAIIDYRNQYIQTCQAVIENHKNTYGELSGTLQVGPEISAKINWLLMTYLTSTIGAQTLAIRGSEKSAYGKLFEKLILGSLLTIFGFKHINFPPQEFNKVFWLSSREEKRESDATLLFEKGQGARFDIGFIGRGNPEISLDKVSRFEREITLGRSSWFLATIILVDRIGERSRIETLAKRINGTIIQMSGSYWPKLVAKELKTKMNLDHPLVNMADDKIESYIKAILDKTPLEPFIGMENLQARLID